VARAGAPEARPNKRHVRLAYQPPASNTFLSEQTSHQQPASSTFISEQTSTSHQPNEQAEGLICPFSQPASLLPIKVLICYALDRYELLRKRNNIMIFNMSTFPSGSTLGFSKEKGKKLSKFKHLKKTIFYASHERSSLLIYINTMIKLVRRSYFLYYDQISDYATRAQITFRWSWAWLLTLANAPGLILTSVDKAHSLPWI
jgi:hypothetical protein